MKIGSRAKAKVPPVEPGTYMALCVGIYDLGEQETEYNGKTRYANKIQFTFEIPALTIEIDGEQKPRQLSRAFAVSTSKKSNLRAFLSSWAGKKFSDEEFANFETDALLGKSAMIQVVLNESGEYANIDTIMQLPQGIPALKTATQLLTFDMEQWDDKVFEALPDWVQEKIKNSTQYKGKHAPETEVDFPKATAPAAEAQASGKYTEAGSLDSEEVPF